MEAKPLGDITPVSPLDFEAEDDASSNESLIGQQVQSERLVSLRQTQHELAWQVLEEQMRPRAVLPRFPLWLGPSFMGGICFEEDFQVQEQESVLGEAMKGFAYRCTNISSISSAQKPEHPLGVLIRPLDSYESRRCIARQRRILEKLTQTMGAIQLQRVYVDLLQAYLVFRLPERGCRLCGLSLFGKPSQRAIALTHAIMQALSEIHAAGVCLLDVSADSIWVADDRSVTFLDFSMAHEFVPGEAEHVCALPALQLTQQHAAPEVVSARLANDISGRLTPFNGPKADVWAVGQILKQTLHAAADYDVALVKQSPAPPAGLTALLSKLVAPNPASRPDASQALQMCRELQDC